MNRRLWDTAEALLVAWAPPGTDQTTISANRVVRTERGGAPDLPHFLHAYDQLLWEIVTSPREDLEPFAATFFSEPNYNLPAPLQTVVLRLLGLDPQSTLEQTRAAVNAISLYCSREEEEAATGGIRKRIEQLERESRGTTDRE